jgi:hypothetical protein
VCVGNGSSAAQAVCYGVTRPCAARKAQLMQPLSQETTISPQPRPDSRTDLKEESVDNTEECRCEANEDACHCIGTQWKFVLFLRESSDGPGGIQIPKRSMVS